MEFLQKKQIKTILTFYSPTVEVTSYHKLHRQEYALLSNGDVFAWSENLDESINRINLNQFPKLITNQVQDIHLSGFSLGIVYINGENHSWAQNYLGVSGYTGAIRGNDGSEGCVLL